MEAIIILILLFIVIFCFKMAIETSKMKKAAKKRKKEQKQNGVLLSAVYTHVNGLPIAENVFCEVLSYSDRYEFNANGMNFKLTKDKITDVCIKTETEIQKQYVSSVGGAVGGAVLFGPLGAMIGGRAKQKTTKTSSNYLIITYKSDNEIKYMGFDVTNSLKAFKFVDEFRENRPNSTETIEL